MRFSKSLAIAASTLALATGAAFAGDSYHSYEQGGPERLSDAQEPMDSMDRQYFAQPQEYEVYEVYVVPAEIVLIPIEPREGPISGDELG